MTLRDKVTEAMLTYAPIPPEKVHSKEYPFYCRQYMDNLYQPMGDQAMLAYQKGSGGEMVATEQTPAKMASVASSSAMTCNLLGDGPAEILWDGLLPRGAYQVQYEKQMYTLNRGSSPANLDAFLSNERTKTAIFCEMKLLEWLNAPGTLKSSYRNEAYYFASEENAVSCPLNAWAAFQRLISQISAANFQRYDAWQMFKHLLAIYNYTSYTTRQSVNAHHKIPSMAGKYERIILLNVVNEFPAERIADKQARESYTNALMEEQLEAAQFTDLIRRSEIPHLFDNNCHAGIEVVYLSAKDFAEQLDMTPEKRAYLKRYFP